jgi:hypothetical protein
LPLRFEIVKKNSWFHSGIRRSIHSPIIGTLLVVSSNFELGEKLRVFLSA